MPWATQARALPATDARSGGAPATHGDHELTALVATGLSQGYLTFDQVNAFLPDEAVDPEKIDALLVALEDQGIELVMQKQYDINTMKTRYRLDTLFGVVNKQPEMSGIILFGQV